MPESVDAWCRDRQAIHRKARAAEKEMEADRRKTYQTLADMSGDGDASKVDYLCGADHARRVYRAFQDNGPRYKEGFLDMLREFEEDSDG